MSEAGIIGGVVAGACAISLYLVKRLTNCICSGQVFCLCRPGSNNPDNSPIDTLNQLYEEKWDADGHHPYGGSARKFVQQDGEVWDVTVNERDSYAHLFQLVKQRPESGRHYLRLKLSNVTNLHVYLFIKRYQGDSKCYSFSETHQKIYHKRAINGINIIDMPSFIGQGDVTKEQIGITIDTKDRDQPSSCVISQAYYSDQKLNMVSCCGGKRQLYYNCLPRRQGRQPRGDTSDNDDN